MTRSVSPRLLLSLRGIVLGSQAPGATARAMAGAVMSAFASLYGERAAAEQLYAMADAMVGQSGQRSADEHLPPHLR